MGTEMIPFLMILIAQFAIAFFYNFRIATGQPQQRVEDPVLAQGLVTRRTRGLFTLSSAIVANVTDNLHPISWIVAGLSVLWLSSL